MSESKWREAVAEAFRSVGWLEPANEDGIREWAAYEDDVLDALSPVLAQMKREWQAEAWDEARRVLHFEGAKVWAHTVLENPYRAEASGQEDT